MSHVNRPVVPSVFRNAAHILALRLAALTAVTIALSGCSTVPLRMRSDEELADHIYNQADKLPLPGIYELRTTAAGGHVTLGGRVDSPDTLKQLVRGVANTPGLTQLSFFGVEFDPPDVPDDAIVAEARAAATAAIGNDMVSKLGFYCEDHRLFVYGTLPSLPMREKLEEAMRQVRGVGLYHVTCEVVLPNPPSDPQVVTAVRRKFRRPLELPNLTFRSSQVQIASVNNVVYLTGRAPTLAGKLSAGMQAAQVEGVRYVVNRIEVPGIRLADRPQGQIAPDATDPNNGSTPGETDTRSIDFEYDLDFPPESEFVLPVSIP